ncbi:unnamed protein product [Lymnaea stagnalis]|uniref:TIR domain-containing protein n=1 Tax=Lymnaea stagnalis TaxID=6523 RepID=A0AAV2HJU5_LYMST
MATTVRRVCFLASLMASWLHVLMLPLNEADQDILTSTDSKGGKYCCSVRYSACHLGHVVDCTNCGLTAVDTSWMPNDTVSLTLDNNTIAVLNDNAFVRLKSLRNLSIAASYVQEIEVNALCGLNQLEVLNLESNRLPLKLMKFPKTMFRHVPGLRELYIAYQDDKEKSSDNEKYRSRRKRHVGATRRLGDKDSNNTLFTDSAFRGGVCGEPLKIYSDFIDIFSYLKNLTTLSIDGLNSTLHLGEEFSSLTLLSKVTVNGPDVTCITNFSFTGLWSLNVRVLVLINLDQISVDTDYQSENDTHFDDDAFQNLMSLTHLTIDGCRIGNQNIARKMRHFVNRTMTSVVLKETNFWLDFNTPTYAMKDYILLKSTMKYLVQINLSHFSWIGSNIFAIVPRGFDSPVWQYSIKSMDFSDNNFGHLGWKANVIDLYLLKNMVKFTLSSPFATFEETHPKLEGQMINGEPAMDLNDNSRKIEISKLSPKNFQPIGNKLSNILGPSDQMLKARVNKIKAQSLEITRKQGSNNQNRSTGKVDHALSASSHKNVNSSADNGLSQMLHSQPVSLTHLINGSAKIFFTGSGLFTIGLPPSLSTFTTVGLMTGLSDFFNFSIQFVNVKKFTHFYFMNNGPVRGTGHVYGLTNLQLFDLTGSTFIVAEHFFDNMTNLRYLILKSIKPDDFFVRLSCDRLIRYLTHLMYLDLTENNLNKLPHRLFATNPNVTHFVLAKNRFSGIPFDLTSTPNLEFLDLTGNAIVYLDEIELDALSRHVNRVPRFFLGLAGNNIACMCFQTRFLAWIDNSKFLDMNGNYSCTYDNGHMTSTGIILLDLQGFSRQCNGSTSLMLSLILAFIMVLAFLLAYLLSRFKTAIVAFTMKIFTTAFRPMTAKDYKTHVFIGYGDDDCHFVRYTLGRYLEHDLGVTTFIHQRDLGPGYTDQQLFEAIRDSWRILLVITTNFLLNYDQATIVMKYASHSVTSMNHDRVLVLVQETQVKNIPDYLFDVLDDTRIIVVRDLDQNLSYEQRQSIRDCLRSP